MNLKEALVVLSAARAAHEATNAAALAATSRALEAARACKGDDVSPAQREQASRLGREAAELRAKARETRAAAASAARVAGFLAQPPKAPPPHIARPLSPPPAKRAWDED